MAAPAAKKSNTQVGQPLWFAGYASGDLLTAKPTLLSDRFLYVFEKRSSAPTRLAVELWARHDGDLWVGPPDRRRREPDPKNSDFSDVMSPLSWSVQGENIRYFFFASPTRLLKRAIAALEFASVTFPDGWVDFSQPLPGRYFAHPARPPVLLVIDPLTIAVQLNSVYQTRLDRYLAYMMPPLGDDSKAAEATRSRVLKYELAQLINNYLLPGGKDPYNVRKEFADAMGDNLRKYIEGFEKERDARKAELDGAADRLSNHLESPYWNLLASLHTYSKEDTAAWLEFAGRAVDRLASSDSGTKFCAKLYTAPPKWLAATGITGAPLPPEGVTEEDAESLTFIARKAASGVSSFWVEVVPAAVALGKTSVAEALDRIDRVYRRVVHTRRGFRYLVTPRREEAAVWFERWVTKKPVDKTALHEEMSGLKEWVEEGEPMWPKESAGARTARTLTNIARAAQIFNLALKLQDVVDPGKEDHFETRCELAVAILDTVESFEKVLEPQLKKVMSEHLAGASFKFMGSLAGFLHVALAQRKRHEALREGKKDLLDGYRVETAIFAVEGFAGAAQGIMGLGEAIGLVDAEGAFALAVGAAASALCFVSFTGAVVYEFWAEGQKKSAFQRFVNHSAFGRRDDEREEAVWASGRSFDTWKEEPAGLKRQRETLTMLFANFSIVPTDRYHVDVHLGATPPGMKLKVTFRHGDQEFPSSPTHHPEIWAHAVIDPFKTGKGQEFLEHVDGDVVWDANLSKDAKGAVTVHVGSRPRGRSGESLTQYCTCDAQLVFESEKLSKWEIAIPPEKPLHCRTMEGGNPSSRTLRSTLPEPD